MSKFANDSNNNIDPNSSNYPDSNNNFNNRNDSKKQSAGSAHINHKTFLQGLLGTLAQIFTDKGVLLMLVIGPIIYGFFYPWPYRGEVVNKVPVGIVDYDRSNLSQTISRYSAASPNLDVHKYPSEKEAINAIYHNDISGYLIIPQDLEKDVMANKPAYVSVLGNNSYFLLNKQVQMGFLKAISTVSAGVEVKRSVAQGAYMETAKTSTQAVPLRIDPMFNTSEGYGAYVVPAVSILILQQTLMLGTALLIGTWHERQKQNATITGWLGRIFGLSLVSFMMGCFYYGWVFDIQKFPRGHNMFGTLLFFSLFAPTVATLGCLFGMWFRERERALQILIFSSLPIFFLSGYPWPVSQLPEPLKFVRLLFPTTPGMHASVQLNQMGASLHNVKGYFFHLMVLWAVSFILLLWVQKRQIDRKMKRS